MNIELFEYLLSQPESDTLDFKSEFYDFSGDTEKAKEAKESKFIKDIISFANTKKDKSSYIIIGIKENETTKEKEFLGVTTHPDDANLQEKIKDKVYPVPEFLYYPYTYKTQQFGIIEILIPKYSEEPYYSKKDYIGGLLKSELYFRRGSSNAEATPEEEKHIREWFKSLKNQSANSSKPQKTTTELTNIPDIVLEDVIGREKELKEISEHFQKSERPLLVTAIGGVGKSTLARAYVKKFRSQYQNIIWIDVTGSFQSSIVSNHTLLHNLKIELPKFDFDLSNISKGIMGINQSNSLLGEEKKSNYDIVLNALRKIQGKNLLVLDNAESNLSSEKIQLPTYPNWYVLATSRERIEGFFEYPLEYLSKEKAVQLFRKYAGDRGSNSEIEKLLELVNFYTLIIELLAKILKESLEINSVEELYRLLTSHRLDDERLQYKIQTDHSKQEIELYPYLLKLFDLSKLEADNFSIPVLKQICLFPPDFLPASIFIELLESEEISKKEIIHTLKYLSKKGWLEENNKDFKIHKTIKGFLLWYILKPIFEDCKVLVGRLGEKLKSNEEVAAIEVYADIALSMSEYFMNYDISEILYNTFRIHFKLEKYFNTIQSTSRFLNSGFSSDAVKDLHAIHIRGNAYLYLKSYRKALEDFDEVIRLNINDPIAYNNRGYIYAEEKNYEKAISDFSRAIELNSGDAMTYFNRGLSYGILKDYDKAILDFSEGIRIDPNNADAFFNRGVVFQSIDDYDKAILDYNEAIKLNSKNKSAYYNRGVAYDSIKDYSAAISDYTQMLPLEPNDFNAYLNRGIDYSMLQDYYKAISDFSRAIQLNPKSFQAYFNRAKAYDDIKEYDQAILDYTEAIRLDPNDEDTYFNRGVIYLTKKDYENAILDFKKLISLAENIATYYINLCPILFLAGKQAESTETLEKALLLYSTDSTILVELWFYAYAHIPERLVEAEEKLSTLIQNGAKSEDWDFAPNIEKAIADGHPDVEKLNFFAEKITGISFR